LSDDLATGSVDERTYIAMLLKRFAAEAEQPVLRYEGRTVAAAEFAALVYRYARALGSLGIGRGDVAALFAPNAPDAIAIRYAANVIGAGASYLSVPRAALARAELIGKVAPALLVVFPQTVGLVPAGVEVQLASVMVDVPGAQRLDTLAAGQAGEPLPPAARSEDLAVVISSGGSTGVPKGSWRTFASYTAMVAVPSRADRRQLINGHLAYLSEVLVDMTLLGGGYVVLEDNYEAADTLATIEAEKITDLFLVEPQLFELMDHPDVARRDLSSLRSITHVGASAPPTLRRRARERLGPVLAHTYGASEEGLVSVLPPPEYDPDKPGRLTSAGRVLPGVEIRLRRDDGLLAQAGEPGTIEVRSPAMAQGYRNRPDLEAVAFRDGWYRSGDLGRLDVDGYLHIIGRAAEIVRREDGALVSPTLVEDVVCNVAGVRYAVVIVDPETHRWIAAVERWPGQEIDRQALLDVVAAAHGAAAAGRIVVFELERVPLTEQGKPDRETIRRLAGR
jgi:acyl-CoA synthetase (AMP-forming)/AMP-acid ligase II